VAGELLDIALAFRLERLVADRERFVDDENVGVGMGANGKSQSRHHAGRVILYLLIEKRTDSGKLGDRRKPPLHLVAFKPENRAADPRIFASCQRAVEAGAKRQDRRNAAMHLDAAGCRRGDAADDLQKRRLTGAVAADNADALALANFEAHIVEHPVLMIEFLPEAEQSLLQLIVVMAVKLKRLADIAAADHYVR
jgi:hypothetical protein